MSDATAELLFNGTFHVAALRLISPANWYIGVQSAATGKVYAILPEPTGTGNIRTGGTGSFSVENPDTGESERFSAKDLVVFQAATALPQEPVDAR